MSEKRSTTRRRIANLQRENDRLLSDITAANSNKFRLQDENERLKSQIALLEAGTKMTEYQLLTLRDERQRLTEALEILARRAGATPGEHWPAHIPSPLTAARREREQAPSNQAAQQTH